MPLRRLALAAVLLAACSANDKAPAVRAFPSRPVEVVTDKHGIPHIFAKNDADAFWAQGYVMAELRPAQSEYFRLWSQGRRSELFGEDRLATDMFVRAMNFRGFAEKNWRALEREQPAMAIGFTAFAAGFNAKYAEYRKQGWPRTLDVMRKAGWEPEPWSGPQVFAVSQLLGFGLAGSPDIKLEITIAKALLGPDGFEDLLRFEKPWTAVPVPDWYARIGLAPAAPPLRPLSAAAPDPSPLAAAPADAAAYKQALANVRALSEIRFGGSNNFAMAGDKMADGVAVLESDTHQGVPTPGPYVLMHLCSKRGEGAAGTLDLIGAAFPGAPMVVFGHNGKVAWAPTVGFSDLTDFYWEFSDPSDPTRVQRPGGKSLPTTLRIESFKIRQKSGAFTYKSVEVRDIAGFGPILPKEMLPLPVPVKISVRWSGAEVPGPAGAVYRLASATKLDDMFAALRTFFGGTIGFGLASTENRIAYSIWTKHPKRDTSTPFKPWFVMPGNTGPFWTEFIPMDQVPFWIDPPRGYLWSANSDPVGNTFDNDPGNDPLYFGFAYALGDRGQRLDTMLSSLAARGHVTMPELEKVERDQYSLFAEKLIPYFADALTRGAYPLPSELKPYADAVTLWDRRAVPESFEATIFTAWSYQFVADMMIDDYQILDEVSGSNMPYMAPALFHWLEVTRPIIAGIDAGSVAFPSKAGKNYFDNHDTKGHVETRDELIIEALRKAVAHLKKTFADKTNGDAAADPNDMHTWLWKRMLYLRTRHMLADVDPSWEKYDQYRGMGGNVDTVYVGQFKGWTKDEGLLDRFILGNAPSNRFFWRMEPDGIRAKFEVPWGQSEDPENPHYSDLIDDYVDGNFRDFAFTDAEIKAVTEDRRILQ